jgi:hypothetical protein
MTLDNLDLAPEPEAIFRGIGESKQPAGSLSAGRWGMNSGRNPFSPAPAPFGTWPQSKTLFAAVWSTVMARAACADCT